MSTRYCGALGVVLSILACSTWSAASERPLARGKPAASPARSNLPRTAAAKSWLITASSVGPLRLGARPLEPSAGYAASYVTRFYADAQPLEGFWFDDPPVTAYVTGGPYAQWGYDHPGEHAPRAIHARAVKLAQAGALSISMLVVTDPRPKTAQGIGVGDDYARFARAYPEAGGIEHFVGLWEEPSCVIWYSGMSFFFDRCETTEKARVIRITVQKRGSDE